MENVQQSNNCFSWRCVGIMLGSLGILDSIGFGLFFIILFGIYMGLLHVAIGILVIFGINTTASIFWLFGIINKKPGYLLASLVWYAIPRGIMIFLAIIVLIGRRNKIVDDSKEELEVNGTSYHVTNLFDLVIVGGAAYGLVFYVLSVICYMKMKADVQRYTSEIPRMEVAYTTAPQFDIY